MNNQVLMSNNRYLIIKAKGGMGNRMLCAVTGILYGQLTGRCTVVDWRDVSYSNDGGNTFSQFFDCPNVYPETIRFINRLSDFLFMLARWANHRIGVEDTNCYCEYQNSSC